MAVGFILIGLLLILPGSLFESVELNQNRQKLEKGENNRYIAFLRNLRLLEQDKEWNRGEQHRQKKYQEPEKEDKIYEKAAKNLDTIEKDAIVEKADSQSSPTTSSSKLAKSKDNDTSPSAPLPLISSNEKDKSKSLIAGSDALFIGIVVACSFAGLVGLVMAGVCWYRLNKNIKAASEVDYPAYGVTGPTKERLGSGPGDRKLAQSAQMYHYQHQKQQMIAMEKANGEMKHDASEDESEEENEEGDYTVYECPGLAPTGEMEVRNPLFNEETPVSQDPPDDQKDKDTQ